MSTKNIKELYTILISDIVKDKETKERDYSGICQYIIDSAYDLKLMTHEESRILMQHIHSNKPSKSINNKFFYPEFSNTPFWFPVGFDVRLDFLNYLKEKC